MAICREVGSYIEAEGGSYEIIPDRPTAIRTAFMSATKPTLLIVAGKGADAEQKRGGTSVAIESDLSVIRRLVAEYDAGC